MSDNKFYACTSCGRLTSFASAALLESDFLCCCGREQSLLDIAIVELGDDTHTVESTCTGIPVRIAPSADGIEHDVYCSVADMVGTAGPVIDCEVSCTVGIDGNDCFAFVILADIDGGTAMTLARCLSALSDHEITMVCRDLTALGIQGATSMTKTRDSAIEKLDAHMNLYCGGSANGV